MGLSVAAGFGSARGRWRVERGAQLLGHVGQARVLTELQRTDVGHDGPAVGHRNLLRVVGHGAEAVGDHVEEVPRRLLAHAVLVEGGRRFVAAPYDYTVAAAQEAVAGCAVDLEALL